MAELVDGFLPVFTYTDLNDMTTEELHEMYKRHVRGLNQMRQNRDLYWVEDIEVWECKVLQLMLFIDYGGTYIHPTRKRKRSAPNWYLEELKEKLKKMYRRLNYQYFYDVWARLPKNSQYTVWSTFRTPVIWVAAVVTFPARVPIPNCIQGLLAGLLVSPLPVAK